MDNCKIYTVYAKENDMTFIMEEKKFNKKIKLSVVGFYFGSPDDEATNEYRNSLTAEFSDD